MIGGDSSASVARERRPSLVDVAEDALRTWLATGRHRPGERLPPEQELSAHLGISRGTLRTALRRLEESGEIVRRQGSGTYVGRATSTTLDEGLEKLVSYSELARRRGVTPRAGRAVRSMNGGWAPRRASCSAVDPATLGLTVTRVLLLDGQPGSWMRDVVNPHVELPPLASVQQALERGEMVLDVLMHHGGRWRTRARTSWPSGIRRDRVGRALGVSETQPPSRSST